MEELVKTTIKIPPLGVVFLYVFIYSYILWYTINRKIRQALL